MKENISVPAFSESASNVSSGSNNTTDHTSLVNSQGKMKRYMDTMEHNLRLCTINSQTCVDASLNGFKSIADILELEILPELKQIRSNSFLASTGIMQLHQELKAGKDSESVEGSKHDHEF